MSSSTSPQPVLFLDFDDVLCLNNPYGGYDVIEALAQVEKKSAKVRDFQEIWQQLFAPDAKTHLKALHDEFSPCYVLSTSWRHFMNRDALAAVLANCGLKFVAQNLHPHGETPISMSQQLRAREIGLWLADHPEQRDNWVVLDDERSGTGYEEHDPHQEDLPFIVLCREGIGLTALEHAKLRAAFLLRKANNRKGSQP